MKRFRRQTLFDVNELYFSRAEGTRTDAARTQFDAAHHEMAQGGIWSGYQYQDQASKAKRSSGSA